MRLILGIILISISSIATNAQSGEVSFGKSILYDAKMEQDLKLLKKTNLLMSELTYILKFNNKASLFTLEESLQNDSRKFKTVIRIGGGKGVYYTDSNNLSIYNTDYFGKNYNVDYSDLMNSTEWQMLSDYKIILGYKCYLASTSKEIENPNGIFYQKIKAWYCPDLNFSIGPLGYNNLPGCILELQIDNILYKAEKIKYNPNKLMVINKPKSEVEVNSLEFLNLSKELYAKMINRN